MKLPRLILLTLALLIACAGVITAVAARRSADDNGYHCLQLLTTNDQRLLIDLRSGGQVRTKAGVYRLLTWVVAPAVSSDGKYTAYATYPANANPDEMTATLWVAGEDISNEVLVRISVPYAFRIFRWATDRLLLAVVVNGKQTLVLTIDISRADSPTITRREFAIDNPDSSIWIGDALMLREQQLVHFWLPEQDSWTSYQLPPEIPDAGVVAWSPPDSSTERSIAFGYDTNDESGFLIVSSIRGIVGKLTYPTSLGFREVRWMTNGTQLMLLVGRKNNIGGQIMLWDTSRDSPVLLLNDEVPMTVAIIWVWAADASAYLYEEKSPEFGNVVKLHRLSDRPVPDKLLLQHAILNAIDPASGTMLATAGTQGDYTLYQFDTTGSVKTLAEHGLAVSGFNSVKQYYVGVWQTEKRSDLLIINPYTGEVLSIPIRKPFAVHSFNGAGGVQIGDLLVQQVSVEKSITFIAVNLRTKEQVKLVPIEQEREQYFVIPDSAFQYFRTMWRMDNNQWALTEFAPDGTPIASFVVPTTVFLQPANFQPSSTHRRMIVQDDYSSSGDQYLLFPDGSYKLLINQFPGISTYEWTADGEHIVGANINNNGIVSAVYLLDADGNTQLRSPVYDGMLPAHLQSRCQ